MDALKRDPSLSDVSRSSSEEGEDSYILSDNGKVVLTYSASEDKRISSFSITMFYVTCIFVPGFYTLQRSFSVVGWYAIVIALIGIFILCYTSILLSQTQEKIIREDSRVLERKDMYPYIIEMCLGKTAGIIFMVLFNILLVSILVGIMGFMSDLIRQLFPLLADQTIISMTNQMRLWSVVILLAVLPLSIIDSPKSYWFIGNGSGVLSLLTAAIIVAILISRLLNKSQSVGPSIIHSSKFNDFLEICSFISLIQLTFGPHPILPTLQLDAKEPSRIPAVVIGGLTLGSVAFIICSSLAYGVFGSDISSSLLNNLYFQAVTTQSTVDNALIRICTVILLLQGIVVYSIYVTPLNYIAESTIRLSDSDFPLTPRIIIRASTTVIIGAFCIILPHFVPILVISSSLLLSLFNIILPIVCYSVYTKPAQGVLRHSFHFILIAGTVVSSTFAVYGVTRDIYWIMIGQRVVY